MKNVNKSQKNIINNGFARGAVYVSAALVCFAFMSRIANAVEESIIEEIIITAQKREAGLQDTSVSVTAIPESELTLRNIDDIADYLSYVPGVFATEQGSAGPRGGARLITIRGIVPGPGDNAFGYYLDESPLMASDPRLYDISRIEVLRGPQGTLYGQGTSGGAIKIVTNQADLNEFQAKFLGEGYNLEHGELGYQANAALNFPLIKDTLALRLVGYYREEAGFIDRVAQPASQAAAFGPENAVNALNHIEEDFNDETTKGVRAQLRYEPSANFSITPSVIYQKTKVNGRQAFQPKVGDLQRVSEIQTPEEEEFVHASVRLNYQFDWAEFTYVGTYMHQTGESIEDISGFSRASLAPLLGTLPGASPLFIFGDRKNVVQELRLASPVDQRFRWLAGFYYDDRELTGEDEAGKPFLRGETIGLNAAFPAFFPTDTSLVVGGHTKSDEKSLFGEIEYDLTEKLTATIGLRYYVFETDRLVRRGGIFFGTFDTNFPIELTSESRNTGLNPKFSLSYDVTDDIMVFGTAAEGFRRGGTNIGLPSALCGADLAAIGLTQPPTDFDPDSLWSYELGAKTSWFNNRFVANMTGFYVDWSDVQQSILLPTCRFSFTTNVGEARSAGFELEMTAMPMTGLEVSLSLGFTDTEITDIPQEFQFSAEFAEGDRLALVPDWSVSSYVQKSFPVFDGSKNAYLRFEYQFLDDRTDTSTSNLESFELMHIRAGLVGEKWNVQLFVENLTDSRPILAEDTFGGGPNFPVGAWTLRPRSFGVQVGMNF